VDADDRRRDSVRSFSAHQHALRHEEESERGRALSRVS